MARVLFRDSQGRDGEVKLDTTAPSYIGRATDCAIRTDDAMVSRKHSMIRMEGDRFYVEDLGSSNGTHVNNTRVTKHWLNHNDVVRCGSLWLRYVDDGPAAGQSAQQPQHAAPAMPQSSPAARQASAAAPAMPQPAAGAPPKKPGTARIDAVSAPAAAPSSAPAGGHGAAPGTGGQPGAPGYGGAAAAAAPQAGGGFGQPPGGYGQAPGTPAAAPAGGGAGQPPGGYGQPPGGYGGQPAQAAQAPQAPQAPGGYGQPPPAPAGYGQPPAMPGAGAPAVEGGFGSESSVVVDMGDDPKLGQMSQQVKSLRGEVDELQASYDREVADGKRMRAESSTLKDRIEEMRRSIQDRDEQVTAHTRVAEELREELNQTKADMAGLRNELGEAGEDVLSRERQLSRVQDDVVKLKEEIDDSRRQLTELSKTKDEGWKKLNEQLGEIEHLREVINEQERMLEERRVGLVSQEEVIKELRADREKRIKATASLKAERDELRVEEGRRSAQIQAIDEENRRLGRLLVEVQSGSGASAADVNHTVKLAEELKNLRIEVRKLESDRDRAAEQYERAEKEVDRLERSVAKLEIDVREANDERATAVAARTLAEEASTKAQVDRHRAAEEGIEAARARDSAQSNIDDVKRELDKARRQLKKLEEAGGGGAQPDTQALEENLDLKKKLREAEAKVADVERGKKSLEAEIEAAKADAKHARAEAEAAALLGGDTAALAAPTGADDGQLDEIKSRAQEVYDEINDLLSQLRNDLMLVQGEFGELSKEQTGDSVRIISDTLDSLIGYAEEAKGVLRGLKELVSF